ncbi:cytochrome P450 [Sporodiniella umbellata]|nr:cytochrome P450 [Sporodiniella umbellata]
MNRYSLLLKEERFLENPKAALSTLVLALLFSFVVKVIFDRLLIQKSVAGKEIPSPKGAKFLLGHILYLKGNPGLRVFNWHKELGPVYKIKAGMQSWVFIQDLEMAHDLLEVQGLSTSGRPHLTLSEISAPGESGIIATDYSKKLSLSRKAVTRTFSLESIQKMSERIERTSQQSADYMRDRMQSDTGLFAENYAFIAVVNALMSVVFGMSPYNSVDDPECKFLLQQLYTTVDLTNPAYDLAYLFPKMSFLATLLGRKRKMENFFESNTHVYIKKYIQLAQEHGKTCMINDLYANLESHQLQKNEVEALAAEVMVAGTDTMCDEIDAFVQNHGRQPTFEEREMFPYFLAVHKELLRFRSPADLNLPHRVSQDVAYKDYVFPKETLIFVSSDPLHWNTKIYENPDKFFPERFLDDSRSVFASSSGNIDSRRNFSFGWGRRKCLGIHFVEIQFFYLITRILAASTIEPLNTPTGEKIYPDLDNIVGNGFTKKPALFKVRLVDRPNKIVS